MTNVPGRRAAEVCGRTLRQVMFWVPQSGDIGMGVSILSYGGGVQFGLITDATDVPRSREHRAALPSRSSRSSSISR
jgi:hypothetical protein